MYVAPAIASAFVAAILIAGITYGCTRNSEMETDLRAKCIGQGGTVIARGPGHDCIILHKGQ